MRERDATEVAYLNGYEEGKEELLSFVKELEFLMDGVYGDPDAQVLYIDREDYKDLLDSFGITKEDLYDDANEDAEEK